MVFDISVKYMHLLMRDLWRDFGLKLVNYTKLQTLDGKPVHSAHMQMDGTEK